VHEKPSVPEGLVIPRVTCVLLSAATVRPPLSCTATTGWVANATPAVELEGDVAKPSFVAGPNRSIAELVAAAAVSRVVLSVNPAAA
jgi:hypothetical protein